MARESVLIRQVKSAAALLVRGVNAYVHQEQIQQTVVVEIEEHSAGGVSDVAEAGLFSDVLEFSVAQVFEKRIAHSHRRHVQVGQTIVVNIRKGSPYADAVLQSHAGGSGDVFKLAPAEIPPELIPAQLIDEINVRLPVAIDVGHGNS